jgi:hypothetical protein
MSRIASQSSRVAGRITDATDSPVSFLESLARKELRKPSRANKRLVINSPNKTNLWVLDPDHKELYLHESKSLSQKIPDERTVDWGAERK